jgi:hypothetical protein
VAEESEEVLEGVLAVHLGGEDEAHVEVPDARAAEALVKERGIAKSGTPCIDPVLDGGSFVTEAFSRGRSVSA